MGHSPVMRTIGIGATSSKGGPFDLGPSAISAAIDNPDALHKRAVAAGAEIVMALTDQGVRLAGVRRPRSRGQRVVLRHQRPGA